MAIVAAVDKTDRAEGVLREADNLAEKFGDTVHVLHVMKRSEAIQTEEDSVGNDEAIPLDDLRLRAAQPAEQLIADRTLNAEAKAIGRIGDPATEIVDYAEEHGARYVVVSPKRKSQTGKILFGSVAQSVLLNATCPVVSLMHRP